VVSDDMDKDYIEHRNLVSGHIELFEIGKSIVLIWMLGLHLCYAA